LFFSFCKIEVLYVPIPICFHLCLALDIQIPNGINDCNTDFPAKRTRNQLWK
jgi:hypothetical protein